MCTWCIFEVRRPLGGGMTKKNKDLSSGWPKYRVYEGCKAPLLRIGCFRSPACPTDTVTPGRLEDAAALSKFARVIFELQKARPATRGSHTEVQNPYSRDRAVHVYIVAAAARVHKTPANFMHRAPPRGGRGKGFPPPMEENPHTKKNCTPTPSRIVSQTWGPKPRFPPIATYLF